MFVNNVKQRGATAHEIGGQVDPGEFCCHSVIRRVPVCVRNVLCRRHGRGGRRLLLRQRAFRGLNAHRGGRRDAKCEAAAGRSGVGGTIELELVSKSGGSGQYHTVTYAYGNNVWLPIIAQNIALVAVSTVLARGGLDRLEALAADWKGSCSRGISVSCGLSFAVDCADLDALVREANHWMYENKRAFYAKSGNDRRSR